MKKAGSNDRIRAVVRAVLGGVSTLSLSVAAAPLFAADAPASPASSGELEEVVVTGLRASLQQSLDIKRNAQGIVDAISAEDICKFPVSNLATAMERIPGVTVSRAQIQQAVGGVQGSNGGATQITVRGFGPEFNQTLFDGRQVPTATGTRGFDFGALASDFVGQIDVMKTPDSTLSSGAIGATINVKFPKPFDHPGLQLAGSASAKDSSGESKITPNANILFSDTFADDRFGILVAGSYADAKNQGNHVDIQGWEGAKGDGVAGVSAGSGLSPCQLKGSTCDFKNNPPNTVNNPSTIRDWFIQDYGIYQEHNEDKIVAGRLALQAKPTDGLVLTLDDNYSKETFTQQQHGFSVWFNNNGLTDVVQAADGTVTSFVQPGSPIDFQAAQNGSVMELNTLGFNVKWDASEHTSYLFDAYTSSAKLNPGGQLSQLDSDVGYGNNAANNATFGVVVTGGDNLPYPVGFGPGSNAARFLDTSIIGSHVLVQEVIQNKDTLNQFKLEGKWFDDTVDLHYGVQLTHDSIELRDYTTLPFSWQMYAGYGPQGSGGVAPIPANLISNSFSTGSGFISGWGNGGLLPPRILDANAFAIKNYLESLNGAGMNVNACQTNSGPIACNGKYFMDENLGGHQDITEKTVSPYISLSTLAKIADMPLKINLGARYEITRTDSQGISNAPQGQLTPLPADHTAYNVPRAPAPILLDVKNEYRYLLPNLDLSLALTDNVKLRFDASRTLTRPQLINLTPNVNVPDGQRIGALNATGGNPTLQPFLSDNVDIGAEWYYSRNSYVSVDAFVKEVTNFIVGGTRTAPINGVTLPDGSLAQFAITSQVNGPSAEVRGLELGWQHMFGDSGFGFQANATFVGTNKPYDPSDLSTSGFAVTGLANSWNFIPFFEKYGWMARLALNHRAEYLDRFGQKQANSLFGAEPVIVNPATYLDFSGSYTINDHFNIYFEALNLTDEVFADHGRFKEQVLDVVDTGRQYTLGVHLKF
jgi:iron complex outermembrane recepter protein